MTFSRLSILVLLATLCVCGRTNDSVAQTVASAAADSGFVTVDGTHFRLRGKPYYFVGTNVWYGGYLGSPGATGDRARLIRELDQLKANGITNIRVLGVSEASELKRSRSPGSHHGTRPLR